MTTPETLDSSSPPVLQITQLRDHVTNYWTSDRLNNAKPIESKYDSSDFPQIETEALPWEQAGRFVEMSPRYPSNYDFDRISPQTPTIVSGYSTSRVSDRGTMPYSTTGKLFMKFPSGDYVGSAFVIAEKGVFTAGHCVCDKEDGGWAENVLFIPQYDNAREPVGRWVATTLHSVQGWTKDRDFNYDLGGFQVDRLIRPTTGSVGWRANYPPNQGPYDAVGYPARSVSGYNFDGQDMWHSIGSYISGSKAIRMHNNMTGGCSGGPWFVQGTGVANGVNSYNYGDETRQMYSPYFGDAFLTVYNALKDAHKITQS